MDNVAAISVVTSLSPVVLATYWGTRLQAAKDRINEAADWHHQERMACLRGEGCPIRCEAAEAAVSHARQQMDELTPFRAAGAMTSVVGDREAQPTQPDTLLPIQRYTLAIMELVSVLSIVSFCVMMLAMSFYDPLSGIDGSPANFAIYNALAEVADSMP